MASLETVSLTGDISPHFDKLLKDVSSELSPEELVQAVSSIKGNFKGKFEDQQEQDLYSCLHLFANQGLVSEDNLTLLERFVTPKTSKKERIQEKIQIFKSLRQRETKTKEELTGRDNDLKQVMTKLKTGSSSVVNLYGSSGVGKTTLAIETLSKWPGRKFKVDFRGINEMKSVYFHFLNALTVSKETFLVYEANPVIAQMEQLKRDGESDILLLLDNVDQFAGGDGQPGTDLNVKFVTFLRRLLGPITDGGNSTLKILLTSRTALTHEDILDVDNYEVKALDNTVSSSLLQTLGNRTLEEEQREKLVQICQGNPLILNGMAAILRQKIADDIKFLETIVQQIVTEPSVTGLTPAENITPVTLEKEIFDYKNEGIDKDQENCLRKLFFFLPSTRLKECAVSVSLFCRSFSAEAAASILGVDPTEAVIQLEGLRNSKVVSFDPEAKVLSYDIHPLMRKFLRSVGNSNVFIKVFQKAENRFYSLFMSEMMDISAILDHNCIHAFNRFEFDKANFELALSISLKSDHLLIPKGHHEVTMLCYLFEAMLDEKQKRSILNSWAEKVKDDGKSGSLLQAQLICQEASQVLHLEGWKRALEVLKMADEALKKVQKESKVGKLFRLTQCSYLYVQGETYWRAGNLAKALTVLHQSLEIMEDILQSHTSITRCLNAIGNCHNKLGEADEAIKYYTRAYEMRKELSGPMNHFDMPVFKGQIGTVYEGKGQIYLKQRQEDEASKQFRKAIECYKEALELAKELKIPGMLNSALFNRNIANAHAWLREFEEAYQPAKAAYEIRKDILGNHPCTARSAFQMAEICRCLEDYDEASKFYEEAWEIEKSLGQGNHSEVMVRIVQGCDSMVLGGPKKTELKQETLEFYLRYWKEEREAPGFEFSLANKNVIDSINDRLSELGDRQKQTKYQREALWFYEGAWNSPDTEKLPYSHREVIRQNLLQLCKILREKDLLKLYEAEAFSFYETLWKKNKEKMKKQDRIDILTKLELYASSLKDENKAQTFGTLLKEAKRSVSFLNSLQSLPFGSAVPQEIEERGHRAVAAFKEAIEKGSVPVYRGRVMLLGQDRAGKTSLKKSLLGIPFDPDEESTVGIKVDPTKCEVEIDQVKNWRIEQKNLGVSEFREDIAKITAERMKNLEQERNDTSRLHDIIILSAMEEGDEGFEQSKASPITEELAQERGRSAGLADDVIPIAVQYLKGLKLDEDIMANGKEVSLSVWDFAGQHLYYTSHSVFLSPRAVYVLVHNLSKDLSAKAERCARHGNRDIVLENPTQETNLDNLLSWLVSVHCIRPRTDDSSDDTACSEGNIPYLRPPVFVVGTHADKPFENIGKMQKCIEESIFGNTYVKHVIRPLFAVDNTGSLSDYGVQPLQNRIMEVLKHEPYMGEKIPIRWFHFEKVVEELVAQDTYYLNIDKLRPITKQVCHVDDEEELSTMLNFYHDLGVIVKHDRTVVLQAQWLIDLFKQLITVRPFDETNHPLYSDDWQKLKEKGILSMDLVDHVFADFIQKGLSKQDILNMMELYGLIAKFSFLSADGQHQQQYFVPAQLRSLPLGLYEIKPSNCGPCALYLHFLDGFVPHGLFAQLLSRCIVWCSEYNPIRAPDLYQNGARFFIGKKPIFDLVLICRKRFIKIILRQNPQASVLSTTDSAAKAREVRVFIEETLKGMSRELSWLRNLRFELCVACTHCLESPDECNQIRSVCSADDDCLCLFPLRSQEQLICPMNFSVEPVKICGLENWLMVHEKESDGRKLVLENPGGSALKRESSGSPGPAVKRTRQSPGSSVNHPERTHAVKRGSPENNDLEKLANQISNEWKTLGRRLLESDEPLLDAVDKDNDKCSEKAYKMLLKWKAAKGSDATFRVLHDALCYDLVNRRDLAEKFCLVTDD